MMQDEGSLHQTRDTRPGFQVTDVGFHRSNQAPVAFITTIGENLAKRTDLEGLSLLPQLKDAATKRDRPAITSHNQGNHGIRSERYRYIRYADGSEEFYDHQNDAHEWHNLAADPKQAKQIAEHRKWLPKVDQSMAPGSASRTLSYDKAKDEAVWESRITIRRDTPIP